MSFIDIRLAVHNGTMTRVQAIEALCADTTWLAVHTDPILGNSGRPREAARDAVTEWLNIRESGRMTTSLRYCINYAAQRILA
jgi:hypothetical protein